MTQLIDTIDSKKLYADRALKDANGKQIDATYAETPVILKYGSSVTQTKEELTALFKQGRLYVMYDDTKVFPCTATWAGYVQFWFTEPAQASATDIQRIVFNVDSSSWSSTISDTMQVKTRNLNGATGYLSDVLVAGSNVNMTFNTANKLVISAPTQRVGIVVNQTPSYSMSDILSRFYSDSVYAFDPTVQPVKVFAAVKASYPEQKAVFGRTDGTTRQEYTLTYADETFTWTYSEYKLQTQLTFDSTPTADSSNPVTSSGIKTALDAKQNDISDLIPTDASSTNQLATKTESAKVSTSEGATPDYLGNVLKAGDGISLTEADGAITAKAKIRIITWRSEFSYSELYNDLVNGDTVLFIKYNTQLYPMADYTDKSITFLGYDANSTYHAKMRILVMNSDGSWSESALYFTPLDSNASHFFRGLPETGTKTLTAKSTEYWIGYWVPIVSIPIGRFSINMTIYDTTSAYNTSYCLDLLGIDTNWLTVSYSCLNTEKDCLRIWKDSSKWYVGFDGSLLSKSPHNFAYYATSPSTFTTSIISAETRVDPSTVSISGVHLQKPPANVTPDWDQTAPSTASDETELNPAQGSTELS